MSHLADRISGAFFLLFGLAMVFMVNPRFIEPVDGGNISPSVMPNIVSLIVAACGAMLVFKPTTHQIPDARGMGRTAIYVLLLVAGIYAMSRYGFERVAPVLALAIMLFVGERRPLWLILGAVAMPALIALSVTHLLGRALP